MSSERLCTTCGHVGDPDRVTRGSFWIEILLWLLFIVPGLIYSVWRQSSKFDGCAKCGSTSLIPVDSPVAKQFIQVNPEVKAHVIENIRPPSKTAVNLGRSLGRLFRKR